MAGAGRRALEAEKSSVATLARCLEPVADVALRVYNPAMLCLTRPWLSAALAGFALSACSAPPPAQRRDIDSPSSGGSSNGTGGQGTGAVNAVGGSVSVGIGGGGGEAATGGRPPGCNDKDVQTVEVVPTVLLLVDTSGSMFQPRAQLWDPLYNALMDPAQGVVASLQDKVRFGFTSYKTQTRPDPVTCPVLLSTDFGLNNREAIDARYVEAGTTPTSDFKWDTPTGDAVVAATRALLDYQPDPPGPKYILLVTDGNPDTCVQGPPFDPNCGSDQSIKAVQDAYAQGIGTFVIGIGEVLGGDGNTGCQPQWGRCNTDFLQDVANAGAGLPVQAPPPEYVYQACAAAQGGVLTARYAGAGEVPGNTEYFTPTGQDALRTKIAELINQVRGCTFEMDKEVVGDPALGYVEVNGSPLGYNDENGWRLEANAYSISLVGTSCQAWQQSGGTLHVSFPCEVAVPRPPH
jgi:hypothetical protein